MAKGSQSIAVAICILSIIVASMWEVAPLIRTIDDIDLYSAACEPIDVRAPWATSWRLRIAARLIVSSPLGDYIARRLLVKNDIPALIELADAIHNDGSGMPNGKEFIAGSEPLIRLSEAEYAWHKEAASSEDVEAAKRIKQYSTSSGKVKFHYNSVYDFYHAYEKNTTTPIKVLARLLDFINSTDSTLRCVESIDNIGARHAAEQSTKRWEDGELIGIWDGIPVLIKPEISVAGIPFTSGMQRRMDGSDIGTYDDIIVQRLRSAGAIIIGTTVMHEKGVQPTGYNPWYGGPNNPYGLNLFPGGSSSGSAVAVATGMVPVAVGFDGGGSVRIPASWSGTVGLAVGFGRIPFSNGKENLFTVVKAGVLTATVNDSLEALILLGQGISEEEGRDKHPYHVSYGGSGPPPPHSKARWSDIDAVNRPVRIGVFWNWVSHRPTGVAAGTTGKDDAVYKAFVETVEQIKGHVDQGRRFELVNFTLPHMKSQALVHGILITSMISFGNLRELYRGTSRRETLDPDDDLQPATEIQIKLGSQITALELLACYKIRNFALSQWRNVFSEQADVILTPTTPMTALRRPHKSDEIGLTATGLFVQLMRFIWPGNLLGFPGLAVPVGTDSDGLPVSVQVICAHWQEANCLAVGNVIEGLRREKRPVPPQEIFIDLLQ